MTTLPTPGSEPPAAPPAGGIDSGPSTAERQEAAPVHPVEKPHLPAGKVSLGRLALEAVMIAFGVLLAMSLESWRESRGHRQLAEEALANIRTEIARDAERIRRQIPEQQKTADALGAFLDQLDAGRHPPEPHLALNPPMLSAAAWNTAMSTQALAHMDFGTVQALAVFYESQRWLDRIEDAWLRQITELRGSSPQVERQWADSMRNTMLGYIEIERILLAQAERVTRATP